MRYQGGKFSIAKELAAIIAPKGLWLEPFCGGLSMSVQLAKYGPGIICDAHPSLIALYQACYDGWEPTLVNTEEVYRAAKVLPDTDPLKALYGFGCSFGGKWFQARAKDNPSNGEYYPHSAYRACIRDTRILREAGCRLACTSFFDIRPVPGLTLYCDPPYAGTAVYEGLPPFDSVAFWQRCREWAMAGSEVYVSEYSSPLDLACVWEGSKQVCLQGGKRHLALERLYHLPRH